MYFVFAEFGDNLFAQNQLKGLIISVSAFLHQNQQKIRYECCWILISHLHKLNRAEDLKLILVERHIAFGVRLSYFLQFPNIEFYLLGNSEIMCLLYLVQNNYLTCGGEFYD